MSRHGQPMSQTLAQMHLNELKMNDPKLNKMFDKLKKGDTVKIKHSSTLERGKDFIEYIVKSKNVVNKGRVEKITLATKDNPTAVKKFLYKRDGKVTFAVGDMGASIDDIKEKYSIINHELIEDIEVEEQIQEDGHDDVASAIRQCKTVTEDAMQILQKLQSMSPEGTLPTWWSNKLAIASNSMNKIRDYLLVPSVAEGLDLNEKAGDHNDLKKLVGELQNASKMHLAQSKRVKAHVDMMKAGDLKGTLELVQIVRELEKASEAHLRQSKAIANHMKEMGESNINEQMEAEDSLKNWKHDDAKSFAEELIEKYGKPDEVTQTMIKYNKLGAFGDKEMETYVIDESIPHSFPDPHRDFVYTVMEIKVPSDMLDTLGHVTGSIVYDGLKETVTARCGSLEANALTLQFVKDLVEGKIENDNDVAKKTYADRIRKGPLPKSFTPEQIEGIINCGHNHKLDEKYDLYHSTFSGAMQHAYDYAKKKMGITVDPKEIDSKVATGPRKPSEGKTNKYRLKGKGGNLQIQVYNKGGSKPFELNMYKEETELDEMIPKSTMYALVKDGKVVAKGSKSDMMSKMKKEGGKVFNAPSKKVGDTIKEENEMNEKNKLKPGVKFDFRLFDPEDSPGSDKANADMNKEIQKAVRMKDKETARQYMMKVQKKHSKHGATDTEPREVINQILDAIFEAKEKFDEGAGKYSKMNLDKAKKLMGPSKNREQGVKMVMKGLGTTYKHANQLVDKILGVNPKTGKIESAELDEGYESEVKKVLDKEGIDGYFKNGKLYVSKRDAKDAKKALEDSDEITKLPPMVKEENDMTKNLKETIMDMWKEAVSPAQQAAIAISKKEKEKDEGNAFTGALKAAKEKGEKTFTVAGKEYDVKTEKLVGGQKKLDKNKDGKLDGTDFAMLRKQKKTEDVEHERQRYLETKKGSVRESILKIWGEISEKVEYVEYKFKNKNDAMAVKRMLDGMQMMNFDVNDDNISNGELMVDAGNRDMTKVHKDIMKKYRPKVMTQEKKDLTKNEKDDSVKKTDTGKEMTPVDMSPKMPKVKESKNKV